ncbi:MAG: hypothetical protein AMJ93_09335, partial [Anaerolineae bacterium SM23_84]
PVNASATSIRWSGKVCQVHHTLSLLSPLEGWPSAILPLAEPWTLKNEPASSDGPRAAKTVADRFTLPNMPGHID